ncbi:PPM-type phosphatase-like domain, partial [Dillenia turbinata]
ILVKVRVFKGWYFVMIPIHSTLVTKNISGFMELYGDKYLKPYVTADPEVSFTRRDPEDQCLIIASDVRSLKEMIGLEPLYPSRSAIAAALLTRLALARKSADNISVIVIDLRRNRDRSRNARGMEGNQAIIKPHMAKIIVSRQ